MPFAISSFLLLSSLVRAVIEMLAAVLCWKHRAAGPGLSTTAFGFFLLAVMVLMELARSLAPFMPSRIAQSASRTTGSILDEMYLYYAVGAIVSIAAWAFIAYGLATFFRSLVERRRTEDSHHLPDLRSPGL